MDSLSSSLEVCGSTVTVETEAVAGKCSIDNIYGKTGAAQLDRPGSDKKPCDGVALTEGQESIEEIKELHAYLDMVKTMVRPGCSPELLKIALDSMSTLFKTLTFVSSTTRPHASL